MEVAAVVGARAVDGRRDEAVLLVDTELLLTGGEGMEGMREYGFACAR